LTLQGTPRIISIIREIQNIMLHDAFQALADPTRREILRLLKRREMSAGEIADRFALAKSTLSAHFAVLKGAGLILAEKQGTTITYSLNVSAFEDTLAAVLELFQVGKTPVKRKRAR
jgi:ArsR family transcriptional regulator, arsenate/arsenite/antimonite-responsive transcriptional repressor